MVMGAMLTQPQRMRRARVTDPGISLASDLTSLAMRLAQDTEQGGQIARVAQEALEQALQALIEERRGKFQAVAPRLAAWFLRALRALTGVGPELRAGSPAEALGLVQGIIGSMAQAAQNPRAASIHPYVAELLGIVQTELGLSLPALESAFWNVVEVIIDRLESMPPEPSSTARENRLDTIRMLRRIRKLVRGRFPLPVLDADRIAAALAASLQRVDAAALGRAAQCISEKLGTVADAGRALEELAPLGPFNGFRSIGAAAAAVGSGETYAWYASWLLGEDVVINSGRTEIRQGDNVIHTGSDLTIANIPVFETGTTPHYVFAHVDLEAMETLTFVSFVSADAIVVLCHLVSTENGDFAANGFNAGTAALLGIGKIAAGSPVMSAGVEDWVFPLIGSFLGSFQGVHTKATFGNGFLMWLTLFFPDFVEAVIYKQVSIIARDLVLSSFTLINNEGPFESTGSPDTRPLNRKHIDGVAWAGEWLGTFIFFKTFPRDEYAQPFISAGHAARLFLFWDLFLYTLFFTLGRLTGCLVAMGVGRAFDFEAWVKPMPVKLLVNYATFWVSLYMDKEGDTNGGRYNPAGGGDYAGYPPKESSPYMLPYPKDQTYYVIQGNQGFFSHYHQNLDQTYSYDFSMDQDDHILASRPGTVVDYFDWVADDTNPSTTEMATAAAEATASGFLKTHQTTSDSWNFIAIRHDVDDAGSAAAPDNVHDKAAAGAVITTYAIYGHGRKGSVRAAFTARGITEANIIGSKVQHGHRIMRSGDTGVSFNNHLHMMVQEGPAATAPPIARSSLSQPSLPFVFKDIGVLKKLDWYTSTTEERP